MPAMKVFQRAAVSGGSFCAGLGRVVVIVRKGFAAARTQALPSRL
jgi:hypothetical protein